MEFKDVAEVIQARTVISANELLGKGWTLLAVVTGDNGPDFVLGRAKNSPELPGLEKRKIPAMKL